ncbi:MULTISPECIES: hypothetical protein [unclassified Sulfitobacter]|jgi:hypothetical protein|nr:hypothetical protein [Sulfitobacter sp. HGT1]
MKAFLISLVALVVITVGANRILQVVGFSSATAATSSQNVRLSD